MILLNGKEIQLPQNLRLASALETWSYQPNTFAVAVNKVFIPRSQYQDTCLQDGDQIDIVTAMQGG